MWSMILQGWVVGGLASFIFLMGSVFLALNSKKCPDSFKIDVVNCGIGSLAFLVMLLSVVWPVTMPLMFKYIATHSKE